MNNLCPTGAVYGIFGAGGHGREIAWLARHCGIPLKCLRFLVDPGYVPPTVLNDIPVLSTEEFTRRHPGTPVFVAIGDPHQRLESVKRLRAAGHRFPPLISCRATLSPSAQYDEGVIVFPGAVVTVNVRLG